MDELKELTSKKAELHTVWLNLQEKHRKEEDKVQKEINLLETKISKIFIKQRLEIFKKWESIASVGKCWADWNTHVMYHGDLCTLYVPFSCHDMLVYTLRQDDDDYAIMITQRSIGINDIRKFLETSTVDFNTEFEKMKDFLVEGEQK